MVFRQLAVIDNHCHYSSMFGRWKANNSRGLHNTIIEPATFQKSTDLVGAFFTDLPEEKKRKVDILTVCYTKLSGIKASEHSQHIRRFWHVHSNEASHVWHNMFNLYNQNQFQSMSNVPENLKYTKTHEWVSMNGNVATVGITDYAQHQLTDIVFVDFPKVGETKKKGSVLLTVESVKSAEDVFSPVDGEVSETNKKLVDSPELLNKDSYANWMVKMKVSAPPSDLLSPADYRKHIGE